MSLMKTSTLDQDQHAKGHIVSNTWSCCVSLGTYPTFSGFPLLRDWDSPVHPQMDFLRFGKNMLELSPFSWAPGPSSGATTRRHQRQQKEVEASVMWSAR